MQIIEKITKEKQQFYLIELSSGEKLRVSEDTMVSQRLLKGQALTETRIEEIKKTGRYAVGLQLALNYLSYQLRSKKEISLYLKEKEIPATDQKKIICRLEEMKLIDDFFYSESYVRTMSRTSDKGPKVIEQQLKKKGIQEDEIQQALLLFTPEEQLELAKKIAAKAKKRYQAKSFNEALQKIQVYLMQKGFMRDTIDAALVELSFQKDEDSELESLKREGDKLWEKHHKLEQPKRIMKVKQSLYQKRFDLDLIQHYIDEKVVENDEE